MPRDGSGQYAIPPGTNGVPDTTIESTKYNGFTADVEQDLNLPRPIVAGGTGATNARDAMTMLQGDLAYQVVNNYDSFQFVSGTFSSPGSATGSPVAGHSFIGICYASDPAVTAPALPASQNLVIEARDESDTTTMGRKYVREKKGGVWGAWNVEGRTLIGGPGGGEGIGGAAADMFFGLYGNSPNSQFIVNTKADMTGTSLLSVNKATGTVSVSAASTTPASLQLLASTGQASGISSYINGNVRWLMQLGNGVAESGGNAGSDFVISRYSDVAGFLGSPLTITRSNGTVALAQNVTVGGAVASGFAGATGTYNFGNTGTKALQYDGTNFIFTGGPVVNNHAYTYTGYGTTTGSYFFGNTGTKYLQYDGTNFTLNGGPLLVYGTVTSIQSATTGTYNFGNSGTKYLLYDGSGFVLGGGSLLVYANVFAIATSTTGYYHFGSSGTKYLCYDGSNFIASGGPLFTTVKGYQPGGGPWADSSDARIKTVLGNYASGLNQIAALQPVRYIFKGNDTPAPPTNYPAGKPADKADEPDQPVMPYPNSNHYDPAKSNKEFIGLIAQQAEIPMPEMVTMERGFIDGMEVTDLRHLDTTPLIFALINAVKELKAKVEALETRVAPR